MAPCSKCGVPEDPSSPWPICSIQCGLARYCTANCRQAHWLAHWSLCSQVFASRYCDEGYARHLGVWWQDDVPLPLQRPVADAVKWASGRAVSFNIDITGRKTEDFVSISSAMIGVPIILVCRGASLQDDGYHVREVDPQKAKFFVQGPLSVSYLLMMNPDTGTVNPEWQTMVQKENAGNKIAAFRTDDQPLTPETLETMVEFIAAVVEDVSSVFVGNGWRPMAEQFTPQSFQFFSRRYFREQREKGRVGFDGPFVPL
ncbi:uncharacterized protein PHACADRAFT_214993 [Phanerochaete carnosa HHB-10118-sp]|uniref:MYND-type domain-containing protein n=1 Tax=Phanerochaete carnosa (strain HHB-10118-sp) TaxID=650164 RepID=K5VA95_PHACS|nr:uncharacterized protein PHACADRAFT_214993 [Phanerochaete carnosa HHB-10118-sp]EKM48008.1 hypothetical protein PHACADRAFT_214993 [Phanerochaete carnosa HHB-10118-sp]